jgi:hypothetical protein
MMMVCADLVGEHWRFRYPGQVVKKVTWLIGRID